MDSDRIVSQYCTTCRRAYPHFQPVCPLDGTPLLPMPQTLPRPPAIIDKRYQIIEMINAGGMGAIYRCKDQKNDTTVALKILRPQLLAQENAVHRFFCEARTVAFLEHPSIVQLKDFGVSMEGYVFLVMEYLPGLTLADLLRSRHRLSVTESLLVIREIAEGLAHAHEHGIIHRDLKPENIFLIVEPTTSSLLKILDFGVASILGSDPDLHIVMGTPEYMSPEQASGNAADGRSDLYSLGVLLYEMITGFPPFQSDTPAQVMQMHIEYPIPALPPLAVPPGVRQKLQALLTILLAKDPDKRPQNHESLQQQLQDIALHLFTGNMDALNTAMFQEAIAPLRKMRTFSLDPWRKAPQMGPIPMENVAQAMGEPETISVASPWTISQHLTLPDTSETTLTLLHAVFDYGDDIDGPLSARAMFLPEIRAMAAQLPTLGGVICSSSQLQLRIVFGALPSSQPAAKQAFACACSILARIQRFHSATTLPIHVRIGIATDTVPSKIIERQSLSLCLRGSSVDVAVRFSNLAQNNQIILDENSFHFLKGEKTLTDLGLLSVRGKQQPIRVYGYLSSQESSCQ